MRLPRNGKEGAMFTLIVSVLSVNLIAPCISFLQAGVSWDVYKYTVSLIPVMWVFVIACSLIVHPFAQKITSRIVNETDSFNAIMTITTLCTAFFMSLLMTLIGTAIANGSVYLGLYSNFLNIWPRNFAIALFIELLIVQPISRQIMFWMHTRMS